MMGIHINLEVVKDRKRCTDCHQVLPAGYDYISYKNDDSHRDERYKYPRVICLNCFKRGMKRDINNLNQNIKWTKDNIKKIKGINNKINKDLLKKEKKLIPAWLKKYHIRTININEWKGNFFFVSENDYLIDSYDHLKMYFKDKVPGNFIAGGIGESFFVTKQLNKKITSNPPSWMKEVKYTKEYKNAFRLTRFLKKLTKDKVRLYLL